jgi:hypothetical protein
VLPYFLYFLGLLNLRDLGSLAQTVTNRKGISLFHRIRLRLFVCLENGSLEVKVSTGTVPLLKKFDNLSELCKTPIGICFSKDENRTYKASIKNWLRVKNKNNFDDVVPVLFI